MAFHRKYLSLRYLAYSEGSGNIYGIDINGSDAWNPRLTIKMQGQTNPGLASYLNV